MIRHLAVNQRLANASKEARWNFRGLNEHVYSETHISDRDCVHLSEKGIDQIRVILKTKVFYEHYSIELEQQGVTFDQNGQNAISAEFEFLAASLPDW